MQQLPRAKASPGFTSEVMGGIARPARRRAFAWRIAAGFAMAASVALVVQLAVMQHSRHERAAELRAEQKQLAADLAAVKEMAADTQPQPMIVLENDRGTRVIVDVDSTIQPAALRTFD